MGRSMATIRYFSEIPNERKMMGGYYDTKVVSQRREEDRYKQRLVYITPGSTI
jgi:hypothetical protein